MTASSRRRRRWLALWLVSAIGVTPTRGIAQMATAERIQQPGWWPTSAQTERRDYVGAAACASCHSTRVTTQQTTRMARTLAPASRSEVLAHHPRLAFRTGSFEYAITARGSEHEYSVTSGGATVSALLLWAFGLGKVGQSYLFERNGVLHESRASYYESTDALDFTPNRALTSPRDLDEAMSRPLPPDEVRRCFGCHSTASSTTAGLDLDRLIPGVTCEACHGPGRRHVEAMERGGNASDAARTVFDPRRLDPADSIDFCGACHATFWDVTLAGERGLAALRSQPFRLQSSKCWRSGDARLACVRCHDPHQPLVRDAAAYDGRCLDCHVSRGGAADASHPGRACPAAESACVSCHMPKYPVPEMHFEFTDHLIRVPQKG
jgi:Cytochrome c554 and c-prime